MSSCASRRYLPVLRGFPAKFIYDPWNAPQSVQAAAKCIIGVHYPKPMVNHAEASRLNIERMKQIYQQLSRYRGLGKAPPTAQPAYCRILLQPICACVLVLGLLASVPSTNSSGNGGMMAYSPGEQQQQGTNSSCEWLERTRTAGLMKTSVSLSVCLSTSAGRVGELGGNTSRQREHPAQL